MSLMDCGSYFSNNNKYLHLIFDMVSPLSLSLSLALIVQSTNVLLSLDIVSIHLDIYILYLQLI